MAVTRRRATSRKARGAKSPYMVFVSHSSQDAWIARVMAEKIRALGADAWLDERDLKGGDLVMDEILGGIDACHEALVLVSPYSVASQWVAFELGAVRAQRKRVTPILNNVRYDKMAPMKDVKAIELNKFEHFLEELRRRIVKWDGR